MANKINKPEHNLLEYIRTYTEPIKQQNLNTLDFAVFSLISYYNISFFKPLIKERKISKLKDFFNSNYFKDLLSKSLDQKSDFYFLVHVLANPRYQDLEIRYIKEKLNTVDKIEEFSALTLKANDFKVVVYRGTIPKSYYGWKEDFEMAYLFPIPSQKSAAKYLNHELNIQDNLDIYITGHSKGGNLAAFSYDAIADEQLKSKIKGLYLFDSPGIENKSFLDLKEKRILKKIVPASSIIGMIFEDEEVVDVVKAIGSFKAQHNLMNWEIDLENNDFIYQEKLADNAIKFNTSLANYVETKNKKERERIINLVFSLIKTSYVDKDNRMNFNMAQLYKTYKQILKTKTPKEREEDKKLVNELVSTVLKGII